MFATTVEQQLFVLLYLSVTGVLIGLLFDFFKAWGRIFHFSRKIVFATDLFICVAAALIVFQLLFMTNWGEVRLFVFLALLLGLLVYYILLSRYLYHHFFIFFESIKDIIVKISKIKKFMQEYLQKRRINYRQRIKRFKKLFEKGSRHDR